MKIQILSDLHMEFMRYADEREAFVKNLPVEADVLVLAGDITSAVEYPRLLEDIGLFAERWHSVIYVPGNHELYGTTATHGTNNVDLLDDDLENIQVLSRDCAVAHAGERFIGSTGWFPNDPAARQDYGRFMNDFRAIHDLEPWVYSQHEWFTKYMLPEVDADDIVVTHHLPHPTSTPAKYKNSPINAFFQMGLEDLGGAKPKLWIHGHTHTACDYMVGGTRVVCNPRGYAEEIGKNGFDPGFVVEV